MDLRDVRENIYKAIREELLGPGSEQTGVDISEEIITDQPSKRYVTGILFNKSKDVFVNESENSNKEEFLFEDNEEEKNIEELKKSMIEGSDEKRKKNDYEAVDDEYYEEMNNAHIIRKSTMGLTFFVDRDVDSIKVNLKGARYYAVKTSECMVKYEGDTLPLEDKDIGSYIYFEDGMLKLIERFDTKDIKRWEGLGLFAERQDFQNKVYKLFNQCSKYRTAYKRKEIHFDNPFIIRFNNNKAKVDIEGEELKLFSIKRKFKNKYSITVMLINEALSAKDEKYLFQPEISINTEENYFVFQPLNSLEGTINPELDLLYRNKKSFGVGHGTSVDYLSVDIKTGQGTIKTDYIPKYEVANTNFEVPKVKGFDILSMYHLSDLGSIGKDELLKGLGEFIDTYEKWIYDIEDVGSKLEKSVVDAVRKNVKNCNVAKERMREGLALLDSNEEIFTAFKLANKAMFIQRIQSKYKDKVDSEKGFDEYRKYDINECRWRGFQLAFLLMVISSIGDKKNKFRDIVDLIWIPTGGGKTEAYLGVTAFTIFFRRINRKEHGYGTTVIMRYTLRLLAAQQFERACKLICACEYIRNEGDIDLGDEAITIGLWIGSEQTPNTMEKAKEALNEIRREKKYSNNKFQLLKCPWCESELTRGEKNKTGRLGYDISRGRRSKFIFKCSDDKCYYSEELPVQIIDECIYKEPPTLLFSTVDKFAMLPWKGEAKSLFGREECDSPELIIQDELHLISGPLGTLVGLFETAIDYLCSKNGVKPKIISSTATICEAAEQVRNLYDRKTAQFPPPGIQIEDSFFTSEEKIINKPGRTYVGICGIGQTQITTEIRLFASLLQRVNNLELPDNEKDKYWTLVAYFNSIRELGKALTLIDDDVKDYMIRMATRTGNLSDTRKIYSASELTSRNSSSEIVKILNDLEKNIYPNNAINVLMATNMISVGVDVPRLNLMTIIGQPKLTSEYIQASSRVGRADPGIVFTLYDGRKSRDESHYEIFQSYHQAFYKYVEPTSITPFSEPALERMLHSVFITMVRNCTILNDEEMAVGFDEHDSEIVKIKEFILSRARSISNDSITDTERILNEIIDKWREKATIAEYSLQYTKGLNPLMSRFYKNVEGHKGFPTMTSMRNVDGELFIKVLKREEE